MLRSLLALLKPNYVGDSIILRSFSSIKLADNSKKDEDEQKKLSFTVSYHMNSCGLPYESVVSVSKHVKFISPERPDVAFKLLRDHGFADTHISKLVKKLPYVLLAKPEEALLPKLEFFHSIWVSSSDITYIICWNPNFLSRSLQKRIIPFYNSLKSFLDNDDKKTLKVFWQTSWITMHNLQKNIVANASILREHGVPPSTISQLLTCYPSVMALNVDKFADYVKKAIGMEFNLSSSTFVHWLQALSQISKMTWEHKMKVYRSLGWSDDEFWLAFKKHPICIKSSEKNITSVVDFLMNKMGWKPSDVARTPFVLCYSMEKRIVLQCSVIRILLFKGLVKKEFAISFVLLSTEKYFLDTFVIKYLDQVPYLLSVFQGKMGLLELDLEFDQKSGTKVV